MDLLTLKPTYNSVVTRFVSVAQLYNFEAISPVNDPTKIDKKRWYGPLIYDNVWRVGLGDGIEATCEILEFAIHFLRFVGIKCSDAKVRVTHAMLVRELDPSLSSRSTLKEVKAKMDNTISLNHLHFLHDVAVLCNFKQWLKFDLRLECIPNDLVQFEITNNYGEILCKSGIQNTLNIYLNTIWKTAKGKQVEKIYIGAEQKECAKYTIYIAQRLREKGCVAEILPTAKFHCLKESAINQNARFLITFKACSIKEGIIFLTELGKGEDHVTQALYFEKLLAEN